jgi:hypothetical protein
VGVRELGRDHPIPSRHKRLAATLRYRWKNWTTAGNQASKWLRESFAGCFSRPGYCWGWPLPWSAAPRCSVWFSSIRLGDYIALAIRVAADFEYTIPGRI